MMLKHFAKKGKTKRKNQQSVVEVSKRKILDDFSKTTTTTTTTTTTVTSHTTQTVKNDPSVDPLVLEKSENVGKEINPTPSSPTELEDAPNKKEEQTEPSQNNKKKKRSSTRK